MVQVEYKRFQKTGCQANNVKSVQNRTGASFWARFRKGSCWAGWCLGTCNNRLQPWTVQAICLNNHRKQKYHRKQVQSTLHTDNHETASNTTGSHIFATSHKTYNLEYSRQWGWGTHTMPIYIRNEQVNSDRPEQMHTECRKQEHFSRTWSNESIRQQ